MNNLDRLFQALSTENNAPFPFTPETVTISPPQAVSGVGYNTKITVSAKPDSGYCGSVSVYYTRVALPAMGNSVSLVSEIPFTKESFLAALNAARATWLTPFDVEAVQLPLQETGVVLSVPVKAVGDGYGWIGSNTVTILIGIPKEADALHQLLHVTMSTLGYW